MKTIDDMIAQLLKKKTDEINHKDFCADDLNINQIETEKKNREKSGLTAKIKNLKKTLPAATAIIQTSATTQSQMRRTLTVKEKEMGSDNEHAENRHLILAVLESGTDDFEKAEENSAWIIKDSGHKRMA